MSWDVLADVDAAAELGKRYK